MERLLLLPDPVLVRVGETIVLGVTVGETTTEVEIETGIGMEGVIGTEGGGVREETSILGWVGGGIALAPGSAISVGVEEEEVVVVAATTGVPTEATEAEGGTGTDTTATVVEHISFIDAEGCVWGVTLCVGWRGEGGE